MLLRYVAAGALVALMAAPALGGTPLNINPVSYQQAEQPVAPVWRAGDVVIITHERALYYLLPNKVSIRYPIAVGRQGFAWSGDVVIGRKKEWPDWYPPNDMREREVLMHQHYLPERVPGGPDNPLGRAALYLFAGNKDTLYRIHGTNDPNSIGKAASSGCIRMLNADIQDLYSRVEIGTRVFVNQ